MNPNMLKYFMKLLNERCISIGYAITLIIIYAKNERQRGVYHVNLN